MRSCRPIRFLRHRPEATRRPPPSRGTRHSGFSNYLQSVGNGLLLGIGQERETGTWNTHLHASLFDVSDGAESDPDRTPIPRRRNLMVLVRHNSITMHFCTRRRGRSARAADGGQRLTRDRRVSLRPAHRVLRVGADGIGKSGEIVTDATVIQSRSDRRCSLRGHRQRVTAYRLVRPFADRHYRVARSVGTESSGPIWTAAGRRVKYVV